MGPLPQWNEDNAQPNISMLHQWDAGEASQNGSSSSFVDHKEGGNNAANKDIRPLWRRILSSKLFWFLSVMAILLLGLVLGLAISLTRAKQQPAHSPSHPTVPAGPLPPPPVRLLGPEIDLGYTKIQGLSYPNGISQWLGVRYAQPPLGNLRFAEPQNVTANSTTQMATQRGHYCMGTRNSPNDPASSGGENEDCLNLDVYAPCDVTANSKLPVYFFIAGGGFNAAYPTQNGSSLVQASNGKIIVVSINYRVSAYGFLASSEVMRGGSLNNGLKDQRMALHWVHDHIASFGGDPGHVVIGGDSAGAGSVTLQLAAYNGRNDNLFQGSIAESQSFGALRTVDESQYQYDALVKRTNCANNKDTLSCLRALDITTLQTQNIIDHFPNTNTTAQPLFAYNPTLDRDFIADYTLSLFDSGRFVKLPTIYGDVSNEGTVFVPHSAGMSVDASNAWLQAQFPELNETQLSTIQALYPPEPQPHAQSSSGKYWSSTATAYGDLRYVCPGFDLNNRTAQYVTKNPTAGNWNYQYNVSDPGQIASGLGVPHVAEQSAIWASPVPASDKGTNAPIVPLMQGYWISFIRAYNPNVYRAQGAPAWDDWGKNDGSGGNRLLVQNPGPNGDIGTTKMEIVDAEARGRCAQLLAWGVAIKQ